MALVRAAVLHNANTKHTNNDNSVGAPLHLAHHMTLGRGGEGRILPNNDDKVAADASKKVVVKSRVIFDAHARLRSAHTRRALAALSEQAVGAEGIDLLPQAR